MSMPMTRPKRWRLCEPEIFYLLSNRFILVPSVIQMATALGISRESHQKLIILNRSGLMQFGYPHSTGSAMSTKFLLTLCISPNHFHSRLVLNRSPMADFGYDISNHTDVDPLFGSLADFDTVISRCLASPQPPALNPPAPDAGRLARPGPQGDAGPRARAHVGPAPLVH